MSHDLKQAIRSVLRTPILSGAVVLSIGLGLGLNTAVFGVVNAVLLEPLDYPDPNRLVVVRAGFRADGIEDSLVSGGVLAAIQNARSLKDVSAVAAVRQNFTGTGLPVQVQVAWVSRNMLRMLGVMPTIGRLFALDEPPGRVLLSHGFWQRQLASDPHVLGRSVFLDGRAYEVVGVTPPSFRLDVPRIPADVDVWKAPDRWWQNGDIWSETDLSGGVLKVVARLRAEDGLDVARAELDGIGRRLSAQNAELSRGGFYLTAEPLKAALVSRVSDGLWLLLAAAAIVLFVACANVMNLQVARAQRRRQEIALRFAIGASRGRVIRLLLIESGVLATSGGILGLLLGKAGLIALNASRPVELPRVDSVALDPAVLAFTAFLSLGSALLFGLVPALSAARSPVSGGLIHGRAVGRAGRQWTSQMLVSSQVALSLVLMVCLGSVGQSLAHLYEQPLGFSGERLLTFTVSLPGARYARPTGPDQFLRRLEDSVKALPGVRSAASIWPVPFSRRRWSGALDAPNSIFRRSIADYRLVTPAVFETIDAKLVEGRTFIPSDSRHSVVVSRSAASRAFPDQSAVGRVLRANPWGGAIEDFQIVGVVADQRHRSRGEAPTEAAYFDARGWSWTDWEIGVVVRTEGDPASLIEPIRRELARLDPEIPMAEILTMDQLLSRDVARQQFALTVLGGFSAICLILAALGLYGIVSWSVEQRRREVGVRLALGALPRQIVAAFVASGLLTTLIGVLAGVLGAAWTKHLLAGVIDGSSANSAGVPLISVSVLLAIAFAASILPARQAAAIDPGTTLRAE